MASSVKSPETTVFPNVAVSSEIFEAHPEAVFWVGKVATSGSFRENGDEYSNALGSFRANVYVHELGYLGKDKLDIGGREFDEYDDRSIHYAVIENGKISNGVSRIVGCLRLITKDKPDDKYPIENYFPEVFDGPIGLGSAEVSRFISRYPEDKFQKHVISLALIRSIALLAVKDEIKDYYCIIENPLLKLLNKIGISLEELGEPKEVPEQGGTLYPIRIDPLRTIESVTVDKTGNILLQEFFKGEFENGGTGFYPANLIGGVDV